MTKMEVEATLDRFHAADGRAYFALFAPEGVFLGTDASERWTVAEFAAYALPFFEQGKGWTYTARQRNVVMLPGDEVAMFDELLDNASYGVCRGTGVLRKVDGAWRIAQYHLTIPVPNALAKDLVAMIRELPV